ncbi:MAG: glycosyltransferase [Candidatus Thorarchaeota archaeon]
MNLVVLSNKVGFPFRTHRSPEHIKRITRLATHFDKVYLVSAEPSKKSKINLTRDPEIPNIYHLRIDGNPLTRQVLATLAFRKISDYIIYVDTFANANVSILHLLTSRTKLVTTMRGWDSQVFISELRIKGQYWLANLVRIFWPIRDFFVFKRSQSAITVTKGLARYAEKRIGKGARSRVHTILRSMKHTQEIDENTRDYARSLRKSLESEKPNLRILITVGRLSPGKRIDIAIDTLAILKKNIPDTVLLVVGDGPERKKLERHAVSMGVSDSVKLLGRLPNEKVLALHEVSDIMIFPSVSEGFAKAPHEALIMGCPVVSYRFHGSESLGFDWACHLIDKTDPKEYALAIEDILSDISKREELIRRGHILTARYLNVTNDERVDKIAAILLSTSK